MIYSLNLGLFEMSRFHSLAAVGLAVLTWYYTGIAGSVFNVERGLSVTPVPPRGALAEARIIAHQLIPGHPVHDVEVAHLVVLGVSGKSG